MIEEEKVKQRAYDEMVEFLEDLFGRMDYKSKEGILIAVNELSSKTKSVLMAPVHDAEMKKVIEKTCRNITMEELQEFFKGVKKLGGKDILEIPELMRGDLTEEQKSELINEVQIAFGIIAEHWKNTLEEKTTKTA